MQHVTLRWLDRDGSRYTATVSAVRLAAAIAAIEADGGMVL